MLFPCVWRNHENPASATHIEPAAPQSNITCKPQIMSLCLLSCTCTRAFDVLCTFMWCNSVIYAWTFVKHAQWHATELARIHQARTTVIHQHRHCFSNRHVCFLFWLTIRNIDLILHRLVLQIQYSSEGQSHWAVTWYHARWPCSDTSYSSSNELKHK
jgi:hypothetical protein